jgi:hypothetical protein
VDKGIESYCYSSFGGRSWAGQANGPSYPDAQKDRKPGLQKWFVFMARCADGSLYTGIA